MKNQSLIIRSLSIFFLLTLCFVQAHTQTKLPDRDLKIKIPTDWINKIRSYDYKQNNTKLLAEFERFIKPDSLTGSKAYSHSDGGILNPMFVNLDEDPSNELIGLFGWSEENPSLAVFKMIGEDWYLLYLEPFYMFYNSPELYVANNFSANKTFYIRWLYERGSGIYCDAYHFYKIIENKVHPCLRLINRAHIYGWGLYLNQQMEMTFNFNGANADELWVNYNYNFFPGAVYENDVPWEGHDEISFVKGENGASYAWDPITSTYRPKVYNNPESLTEEKIACFGAFGNDTLFVKAFDYEIKQTLEKGTAEQKKLLKKYLDLVKNEKQAISPNGEMEEKAEIGGLKFYGTKEKK